jgi:hypothetical protein
MRFWRNYDFSKATSFMGHGGWRLMGHVLVLGPLGFAIVWKKYDPARDERNGQE